MKTEYIFLLCTETNIINGYRTYGEAYEHIPRTTEDIIIEKEKDEDTVFYYKNNHKTKEQEVYIIKRIKF